MIIYKCDDCERELPEQYKITLVIRRRKYYVNFQPYKFTIDGCSHLCPKCLAKRLAKVKL